MFRLSDLQKVPSPLSTVVSRHLSEEKAQRIIILRGDLAVECVSGGSRDHPYLQVVFRILMRGKLRQSVSAFFVIPRYSLPTSGYCLYPDFFFRFCLCVIPRFKDVCDVTTREQAVIGLSGSWS